MSAFELRIDLDNAAFEGDDCGPEVARIMTELARQIKGRSRSDLEGYSLNLRDISGNKVGVFGFDIDEEFEEEEEGEEGEEEEE